MSPRKCILFLSGAVKKLLALAQVTLPPSPYTITFLAASGPFLILSVHIESSLRVQCCDEHPTDLGDCPIPITCR